MTKGVIETISKLQDTISGVFDNVDKFMTNKFSDENEKLKALRDNVVNKSNEFRESLNEYMTTLREDLESETKNNFSEFTRSECIEYIKRNNIEVPFDIEEASGDQLRNFLIMKEDNKIDETARKWEDVLKDFFSQNKKKNFQQKDHSEGEEIRIEFE